jgi:hypothetical protein
MRSLVAVVALALVALVVAAALDDREVAFETGLPAFDLVGNIGPGNEICAEDVVAPASFQRVRFLIGGGGVAQPLRVVVTDEVTGRRVAEGRFPGGQSFRGGNIEVPVGDVPEGGRLDVCVINEGTAEQRFYGSPPNRDATRPPALAVVFISEPAPSMLSLVPEAVERSALFKPGWYGAWTTWALLGAVLLVAVVLGRGLAAAYASDRSYSGTSSEDGSDRSS